MLLLWAKVELFKHGEDSFVLETASYESEYWIVLNFFWYFGEWGGLFCGAKRYVNITMLFVGTEYCERYAKRENITNTSTADEESDEEDISEEESGSSDDDIPGHADP